MANKLYPSLEEFYKNNNIEYGDEDIWYSVSDNKLYRTRKRANKSKDIPDISASSNNNDNATSLLSNLGNLENLDNLTKAEEAATHCIPSAPPLEEISWDDLELEQIEFHPDYTMLTDQLSLPPPYSQKDPLLDISSTWIDDLQPDYDDDVDTTVIAGNLSPQLTSMAALNTNSNNNRNILTPSAALNNSSLANKANMGPMAYARSKSRSSPDIVCIVKSTPAPPTQRTEHNRNRNRNHNLLQTGNGNGRTSKVRSGDLHHHAHHKRNELRRESSSHHHANKNPSGNKIISSRTNNNPNENDRIRNSSSSKNNSNSNNKNRGAERVDRGERAERGERVNTKITNNSNAASPGCDPDDYEAWVKWRKQVNRQLASVILLRRGSGVSLQTVDLTRKPLSKTSMKEVFHQATHNDCPRESMTSLHGKPYIMYGIPRVALSKSP